MSKRAAGGRKGSVAEILLELHLRELGLPFEREKRFSELRKWRLDFYLPEQAIGIEVDGGVWSGGRHTRGKGFEADCIKANHAIMAGIRLLRFSATQVKRGIAKAFISSQLGQKGREG